MQSFADCITPSWNIELFSASYFVFKKNITEVKNAMKLRFPRESNLSRIVEVLLYILNLNVI